MTDSRNDELYEESTKCKATGIGGSVNIDPKINPVINVGLADGGIVPTVIIEESIRIKLKDALDTSCNIGTVELKGIDIRGVTVKVLSLVVKNTGDCPFFLIVKDNQGNVKKKSKEIVFMRDVNFVVQGPFVAGDIEIECVATGGAGCEFEVSGFIVV